MGLNLPQYEGSMSNNLAVARWIAATQPIRQLYKKRPRESTPNCTYSDPQELRSPSELHWGNWKRLQTC